MASAALLTTEDRQALLAESATRRRLAAESRLLRRELTLLQTLGAVPAPLHAVRHPDDGELTAQVCGPAGGTSTSGRSGPGPAGRHAGSLPAGAPRLAVRPRPSSCAVSTATT